MNQKQLWFPIVIVMLAGCGTAIPQNRLEQWVENEKETLPRKVDKYVRCLDVKAGDMELIFFYTVNDLTDHQAIQREQVFRDRAHEDVKKRPARYQQAIDHKILITHVYRNASGAELFRFAVKPWEL